MSDLSRHDDPTELSGAGPRFYAFTDNEDWMEMLPHAGDQPLLAAGVSFLVLDDADEDELYDRAEEGEGRLLGRVTIVDGMPVLHSPADLARSVE